MCLKTIYIEKAQDDTGHVKDMEEEETKERRGRPRTSPDRSKTVSTNDAKALKPDILKM